MRILAKGQQLKPKVLLVPRPPPASCSCPTGHCWLWGSDHGWQEPGSDLG